MAGDTCAKMHPIAGSHSPLQEPGTSQTPGLAEPGNVGEMLGDLGQASARMEALGLQTVHRRLLLPGAGPARLARSATCRQRHRSADAGTGQQQRRATNFPLFHQLSLSFNSSQTLDPKSKAISQAAGILRVAGVAADANKVLFFLSLSCSFSLELVSTPRDHILNLLVH